MIHLRPAVLEDAEFLFRLRNDAETRRASLHTDAVSWPDHTGWLDRQLKDQPVKIYIGMAGHEPVGTVRFEYVSTDRILSWTVAPEHRGKGIGKPMVEALIRGLAGGRLKAQIKPDNLASRRIAESVGMMLEGQTDALCVYVLEK
ncbi:MAG: GNAT family N-acetyltransferase [Asticcacaulis sp.]